MTTSGYLSSRFLKVSTSLCAAGIRRSSSIRTAAMCMAVGKVSLELWLMLTSSFGWRSFLPAIWFPRLAMTSLAFMLLCVPLPVCQTTNGNSSTSFKDMTSSQACDIASSFSWVILSGTSFALAWAAAFFRIPNAWIISLGIVSTPTPISKFWWLLCVCAPQSLSAGTLTSPMESCSIL